MKQLFMAGAALTSIALASAAEASILLSGDTNIIHFAVGTLGQSINPDNQQFFTNILAGGDSVLVQQLSDIFALTTENTGIPLSNFYDNMPGVSSVFTNASLGLGALDEVDLFISILPTQPFQASELSQMSHFLDEGGTVLFLGEHEGIVGRPTQNPNINSALVSLGSTMRILSNTVFGSGPTAVSGSQITNAPFTAGISSFIHGSPSELAVGQGTTLFFGSEGQPFIACEGVCGNRVESTPEPSMLLGLGTLALAGRTLLRRKCK